jgi:dTDP-4-amino-4,6-dideoxygalactose transaminase
MFATRHADVATAVARLRAFGVDRRHDERKVPGMYDVVQLGLNYRMSELQAALGRSQLSRVDKILKLRKNNFKNLCKGLQSLPNIKVLDSSDPSINNACYALTMVLTGATCDQRNEFICRLKEAGIGTSVYYPQPVPRMKYYADRYGYDSTSFPNAVAIADNSIALPVGPHITPEDVDAIIHHVHEVYRELDL